jgi:hypothetical protein
MMYRKHPMDGIWLCGAVHGVDEHPNPRPIGEERGPAIGAVHHSPVKIWARVAGSG